MNSEQARWILKFHRPDRPRNTERRQLQQAKEHLKENCTKFCSECGADMRGKE